ncbi:MAG: transcription-repair coupling factor [Cytophagales bacterium]|nr:transcription-repair coupling factor [Bernardetiaceae bacterium]MDW8205298.1 transcription-repair coupling factor [Cytophagales bacterium]
MTAQELLELYVQDSFIQNIAHRIAQAGSAILPLRGLTGSLDAVFAAALYKMNPQPQLFILHDKEEAHYFCNDLQNLLQDSLRPDQEILFFPTSYKRPYQFQEIDNANILQRAEVLNRINQTKNYVQGEIIVTYPEAMTEKVINKRSLVEHTFLVKIGQKIDSTFVAELLQSYDFERTDFVYEPGQFAVRGGIIDVFSYAGDLPYRIELFGDEVESIRTFDPLTQLSVAQVQSISLIPNVQTKLLHETRESLLRFIPKNTRIWIKDIALTLEVLRKYFDKATQEFSNIISGGNIQIVVSPADLFETPENFEEGLQNFTVLEFGKRFTSKLPPISFSSKPQPSFNKDFNLIAKHLEENQQRGITNVLVAEQYRQLERLHTIFEEIDPHLRFQTLHVALREGFCDEMLRIACYTDHQMFERFHRYKAKERFSKSQAMTIRELKSLQIGDYVTHVDYGVGRFAGLEKVEYNGKLQESIRLVYRDDDILYISVHSLHKIAKYTGKDGTTPTLSKLGSPEWENKKKNVKKKVRDIAKELIQLYAKRKASPGYAFSKDTYLQAELETSFLYEDTPDQAKAAAAVKADMEQPYPMDRLICGDVGFGKTEIAIRAAFKATVDGKQVAVLVPTTVLAMQHYKTFSERLKNFPVRIAYINRFKSAKEIKATLQNLAEGKIDILIGTHRIVSQDVKFKDLGLLIIDEEQKFGVKTKERLKEMRVNVDVLTLSATPIPRTLQFSLMGARDLSVITTPPPNRQPVTTEIHIFKEEIIRDAIRYELQRGGQVFFVHNRISDIEEIANIILRLVPDARIGIAHGQMDGKKLETVMMKFIEGEYDVLVSTNIIESGLDIPNANTIIINRAHTYGLSDLHQMRGRVGRSNRKAFCYLLTPLMSGLTADARKRLQTLEEFSDLGDGFKVAMRDLDIRGAGDLLGAEQSGFISDIGFEMYHQILDEAIQELKETEFRELFERELSLKKEDFVKDCTLETDFEILIPDSYVTNISERLQLYTQTDSIKTEEELERFRQALIDRFGPMPRSVCDLLRTVQLRWLAQKMGFEKLTIKGGTLKGYFVNQDAYFQGDIFGQIIRYVTRNPKNCRLKETSKGPVLIVENILDVDKAMQVMEDMSGKLQTA